jgi:hypothetical protein
LSSIIRFVIIVKKYFTYNFNQCYILMSLTSFSAQINQLWGVHKKSHLPCFTFLYMLVEPLVLLVPSAPLLHLDPLVVLLPLLILVLLLHLVFSDLTITFHTLTLTLREDRKERYFQYSTRTQFNASHKMWEKEWCTAIFTIFSYRIDAITLLQFFV